MPAVAPATAQQVTGLGLILQDLAIDPDPGPEKLPSMGRLYGVGNEALQARTAEVLETVGLTDRADDRADEHSGGVERRLNIGKRLTDLDGGSPARAAP